MKLLVALVLAFSAFANTSDAFTATVNSRVSGSNIAFVGSSPSSRSGAVKSGLSTELQARKDDFPPDEQEIERINSIQGIKNGLYLGAIVVVFNIWLFSVPVEFRRTRICNEEDTKTYPTRCMTSDMWTNGIKEYYKNGGGVKFDFSIAPKEEKLPVRLLKN